MKVMKHLPTTICLLHLGMNVEAWVSHLGNLLGQQFHSLCVLTENDRLVNVELWEKGIQAVNFFFFLKVSIELRNTLEGQLIHQINEFWLRNVLLLKASYSNRISRREKRNVLISGHKVYYLGHDNFEVIRKQLVDLIQYHHGAIIELCNTLGCKI